MKEISILIVEDDKTLQEKLAVFLKKRGYLVDITSDGIEGLKALKNKEYDLILSDIMMPNLDGYTMCKTIRFTSEIPIIFLTKMGESMDELKGFEVGCDDYIIKPFTFEILLKRIEVVLKRTSKTSAIKILKFDGMVLNLNTYSVTVNNTTVELTLKEFYILKELIEKYPQVITRENLLDSIWGYNYYGDTRIVDAHIKNIRKKIILPYIKTIKGIGYVLEKINKK